jgi:serine/threonine protein kinase
VAGRYRLLSQIGGGGMGTVWLARDERLGRQVAVKQVVPPPNTDAREAERQRERALREGRIAARLSHPHAISVYDVAVEQEQPWLVMEYLPSRSLAEVLAEDGLLRADQVAQVGAQVADALAATHAAGIVHRDVKPANVLIGRGERVEGLVKITDFGISHASGDVTLTQTGQITGTPAFLAPEVAQGVEPLAPSDVFSLGATLYTCMEGEPPFGMGDNALQLLHRVAGGEVTPPRYAGPLTRPLMRMLAAEPADRPTMPEVRDELVRLAAGRDGDTTTVLMARTDLRSAPGRSSTARFRSAPPVTPTPVPPIPVPTPVEEEPQAEQSEKPAEKKAVVPPAPVPPDPPGAGGGGRRRRRGLVPLLVGAVVVAAAVVLAVALIPQGNGGSGGSAQRTSTAPTVGSTATLPTGSSPAGTSAGTSAGASASSPASSAAGSAAAGPVTADQMRSFLESYHGLLPGNTQAAYALTGPTLRGRESYPDYQQFWSRFSRVRLDNVQAQGGSTATAEIEYDLTDGSRQRELHRFTLVRGADGNLLLDADEFVQALG